MIRSDEHGRILLGTEAEPITTFAINAAGWIEAILRAESVAAWEAAAESRHLLIRVTVVVESATYAETMVHSEPVVYDEDGDPTNTYSGSWDFTRIEGDTIEFWSIGEELTPEVTEERLVPAEHVHIAGPIYPVITPAVIDEEGNITTPAVLDTRPHYNIRIGPWAQETLADDGVTPRWQETVLMWMNLGAPIDPAERNKAEDGVKLSDITLIDPTTINSPAMRW